MRQFTRHGWIGITIMINEYKRIYGDWFMFSGPGLMVVCPVRPCLRVNDIPTNGWDWFTKRGWEVHEVPEPITIDSMSHSSILH